MMLSRNLADVPIDAPRHAKVPWIVAPPVAERIQSQQGGGEALEASQQQRMEARFGHRFSDVRVHADGEADRLTRDLGARAFTVGSHVFWGAKAPVPHTAEGEQSLAHELTHVVQQRSPTNPTAHLPFVSASDDEHEQQARSVAQAFDPSRPAPGLVPIVMPGTFSHAIVQRQEDTLEDASPSSSLDLVGPDQAPDASYDFVETHYGNIWFWRHDQTRVRPHIDQVVLLDDNAHSYYRQLLDDELPKMNIAWKRVDTDAGPASGITQDITTNADWEARQEANIAESNKHTVDALVLNLRNMHRDLTNARKEVELNNMELRKHQTLGMAAEWRRKSEDLEKGIETGTVLVGAAIEGTVGVLTGGWSQAIKPAYDAFTELLQLDSGGRYAMWAEELEDQARLMGLEILAERYKKAQGDVEHVKSMLDDTEPLWQRVDQDYIRVRQSATSYFDRTTSGTFRFSDLEELISNADATAEAVTRMGLFLRAASLAAMSANDRLTRELKASPFPPPHPEQTNTTVDDMRVRAKVWIIVADNADKVAEERREQGRKVQSSAWRALVTAPGTGTPRLTP